MLIPKRNKSSCFGGDIHWIMHTFIIGGGIAFCPVQWCRIVVYGLDWWWCSARSWFSVISKHHKYHHDLISYLSKGSPKITMVFSSIDLVSIKIISYCSLLNCYTIYDQVMASPPKLCRYIKHSLFSIKSMESAILFEPLSHCFVQVRYWLLLNGMVWMIVTGIVCSYLWCITLWLQHIGRCKHLPCHCL